MSAHHDVGMMACHVSWVTVIFGHIDIFVCDTKRQCVTQNITSNGSASVMGGGNGPRDQSNMVPWWFLVSRWMSHVKLPIKKRGI
jgi:hypothetical protein